MPVTIQNYDLFTTELVKFCYDLGYMAPETWGYSAWHRLMVLLNNYMNMYKNEYWYQKTTDIFADRV